MHVFQLVMFLARFLMYGRRLGCRENYFIPFLFKHMTNKQFLSEMDRLENILFSFALRLTRNYEDAQDLMQETILRAYKHRNKYEVGTNFKSWSSTIMRNTYINRYRKQKNRRHVNEPVETFLFAVENKSAIANGGEMNMHMEELEKKLRQINELYSVPFMMFYRGYEYKEIAGYLNIPIGTVKSRIFLARKKLKALIGDRSSIAV
jgi:RNA polymerase sigma factor (sigma-70 family)